MIQPFRSMVMPFCALLLLGASMTAAAQEDQTQTDSLFGEPSHKLVYQLNRADPGYMDHILFSAGAMLRKFGDDIRIVITLIGPGVHLAAKAPGRPVPEELRQRAESLAMYNVEFHVCGNTLKSLGWTMDDMESYATYVEVGAADLMLLQEQGYSYISW